MSDQQEILNAFLALVQERHPTATRVFFETSDQNNGYGFVATGWADAAAPSLQRALADELAEETYLDIDWDSFMKESPEGYATIKLPERP